MNKFRAILSGSILWLMVFSLYTIIRFIPIFKESLLMQNSLIFTFVVLFIYIAVKFHYKNGNNLNPILLAAIMSVTSLLWDALITIPYVLLPEGVGYMAFYTNYFLWIMVVEIFIFTLLFNKKRANQSAPI